MKLESFSDLSVGLVLIAYNRPDHFSQVLDSLLQNDLELISGVLIYIDGAADKKDSNNVSRCYDIAIQFMQKVPLLNVKIHRRSFNYGLKMNIFDAVSTGLEAYESVVVLEDDIKVVDTFLTHMIGWLHQYRFDTRYGHINGHLPFELRVESLFAISSHYMDCWGWATWRDRWKCFEVNPRVLMEQVNGLDRGELNQLTYNHSNLTLWQLKANCVWRKNTWAVNWYVSLFLRGYRTIYPSISLVENIGLDGSGQNCGSIAETVGTRGQRSKGCCRDSFFISNAGIDSPLVSVDFEKALEDYFNYTKPSLWSKILWRLKSLRMIKLFN